MSQVEFDEAMATRVEALYRIGDAVRRRRVVRAALGAASGERVLDVGCGPGFFCAELAEEVGRVRIGGRRRLELSDARARHAVVASSTRASSFAQETQSLYPSTMPASMPRCACRSSSTSPTRRWHWPRCIVRFDRAGGSSCGTSTGQRSRCTRRTPPSPRRCCAPGTSTSPIPHCRAHSRPGCARRVSRKFGWRPIRSPPASSTLRLTEPPCSRSWAPSWLDATGSPASRPKHGWPSSSSSAKADFYFSITQLCFRATKPQ